MRDGRLVLAQGAEQYTPKCGRKQRGKMAASVSPQLLFIQSSPPLHGIEPYTPTATLSSSDNPP